MRPDDQPMFVEDVDWHPPACASCGGKCVWADDAWVCQQCGDEWYPDHGEEYA